MSDPVHVVADQKLKVEHLALAMEDRCLSPGLESLGSCISSQLEFFGGGLRNQGDDILSSLQGPAQIQYKNDEYH